MISILHIQRALALLFSRGAHQSKGPAHPEATVTDSLYYILSLGPPLSPPSLLPSMWIKYHVARPLVMNCIEGYELFSCHSLVNES